MSSQLLDRSHPVAEFAGRLVARLDQLADVATWTMRPEEQRAALTDLAQAEAQLTAMRLRVLGEAERTGATDARPLPLPRTGSRWRPSRPGSPHAPSSGSARHSTNTGASVRRWPPGRVNIAQARAIVKSLDRLPTSGEFAISQDQRLQAEEHLVGLAVDHDAKALLLLGRHLFEVIAPDLAENYDGQALEAEEAAALRRTTLAMRQDDEGTCHGTFRIPALHGQILRKLILALTSPARSTTPTPTPAPMRTCPPRCGTVSRSASSSKPSRPSPCPPPVAARPRSWSP